MRILLVEDSPRLQRSLSTALRRTGYAVDLAGDGEEGLWLAQTHEYDAIVLDLMVPKRSGLEVLKTLRAEGRATHVLILTARDTVPDRVIGLEAGADDYLVKPFALEELLARVQALCRRTYGQKNSVLRVADLELDTATRAVTRAGQKVELTGREYHLLEYLARRQGEVVPRTDIEAHIYDGQTDPMSNVVDSAICSLRKKLTVTQESKPIVQTRRGHGYMLADSSATKDA